MVDDNNFEHEFFGFLTESDKLCAMKIAQTSSYKKTDALFIFLESGNFRVGDFPGTFPVDVADTIKQLLKSKDFEGKASEVLPLLHHVPRVFLVGTGKSSQKELQEAGVVAIKEAQKRKYKSVSFVLPEKMKVLEVLLGALLGAYNFKIGETETSCSSIELVTKQKDLDIKPTQTLGEAVNYTRDLVNTPADRVHPQFLAAEAKAIAKKGGAKFKVQVLGEKEAKKFGMGGLLAVGQGSDREVQLIVLEYNGAKKSEPTTALVGKGVCFDTGGYNLKVGKGIDDMKMDMGGAASVLGTIRWLAENKPKCNVIGVIGAVENMISAKAYRPGDILTMMNGKTVEITNTDAEGRLVLADALHYTVMKLKPSRIIDLATLTGAVIVALGDNIAGVMGNDEKLLTEVQKAAETVGEETWELPITDFFREKTKGSISDLVNWTAGVNAGSSMAGAFLQNFVGETPWLHIDIAGTAFSSSASGVNPKGATGTMVRTLVELLNG